MMNIFKNNKLHHEVYVEFARVRDKPPSSNYDYAIPIIPHLSYDNVSYDIYPYFLGDYYEIKPHCSRSIPTGLCSYCPPEHYFQLHDEIHILEKGVKLKRQIIKNDYKDEWYITLTNTNDRSVFIARDFNIVLSIDPNAILINYMEPIAQFFILRNEIINVNEVSLNKLKYR